VIVDDDWQDLDFAEMSPLLMEVYGTTTHYRLHEQDWNGRHCDASK
jgi:hypothetical protein